MGGSRVTNLPSLEFITDGARHLICVPYSVENLHEMARQLNVKTCWFHKDHYDIPKRRISEIEAKCRIVSPREIVKIIQGTLDLG
jgi:FMN phosphatase YigB (HAD superfamily)